MVEKGGDLLDHSPFYPPGKPGEGREGGREGAMDG